MPAPRTSKPAGALAEAHPTTRRAARPLSARQRGLFAALLMGTGAALVIHILAGFSLRVALVGTVTMLIAVTSLRYAHAGAAQQRWLRHRWRAGLIAGLVATSAYDATRSLIALSGVVSINPFEAIPVFGALLVGDGATSATRVLVGSVYHVCNGVLFALAYATLISAPSAHSGVLWALGLEAAQLTLYPGWLDVRAVGEFAQVSVLSHVVYGLVLGLSCRRLLRSGAT